MYKDKSTLIIANWIFIGVAMLIIQTLLGGITRLTGSGLSITEWKPIMGTLPPLNEMQWQQSFAEYKKIAQFKYINNNFTLSNFKFIFFWEWFHRLWARFISIVFIIPFFYFIVKKYIKKWMIMPLLILFCLGALQGVIGWIMVKSGLNDENLYVSHIRLAIHFIAAMILISYALVFGLKLKIDHSQKIISKELSFFTICIIILLALQLMYGAFMAGLKGAAVAPTWPDINGRLMPINFFSNGFSNAFFFNIINIHFIHRTLAYIILILIFFWWLKAKRISTSATFNMYKNWPLIFVVIQVVLGIIAIVSSTKIVRGNFGQFEWIAQMHQLFGMLLLLSFVANFYLISPKSSK